MAYSRWNRGWDCKLAAVRGNRLARMAVLTGLLAAAGLGVATSPGCTWGAGGLAWSLDRYTYESKAFMPQTVTLMDTRTMQPVRSWEVPVGKKLIMEFFRDDERGTPDAPDRLEWDVWPLADKWGSPTQEMFVPPASARRVDVTMRQTPELAGTTSIAMAPGAPVMPVQNGLVAAPPAAGSEQAAGAGAGAAAGPGQPMGPARADGASSPTLPNTSPRSTPVPAQPAPAANAVAVPGQVVAGRYYLVAARLAGTDADKAVGALNGGGVSARGLAKDGQVWVVVTSPSLSEAEFAHPSSATNREAVLQKVMAIGQTFKTAGGASNFSMASWELMR